MRCPQREVMEAIMEGSWRGQESVLQDVHWRAVPACRSRVGAPQEGQKAAFLCQLAYAVM